MTQDTRLLFICYIMTTLPDIEASLEVCEILNVELQTLSKDADALDGEIAGLHAREVELEQTIEEKKNQLLSGARHLKSLNIQRLQSEYTSKNYKDEISQLVKSFDTKASIYGRLEVEAMLLEREVAWKREDVEKWTTIRDAEKFLAQRNLEPMVQERDALREELDQVRENIRILNDEEEDESDVEETHQPEIEKLEREIAALEDRNEAYRRRMRDALDDLSAKVVITRQRVDRMEHHGSKEGGPTENDARWKQKPRRH